MAPSAISTFLARKQFRPTLWPTLGMLLLVAATVSLGNWQRHRALEKEALRTQYEQAIHEDAIDLDARQDAQELRFRSVRARGTYVSRAQVLIDNRFHAGRPGYEVVTPLKLAGDRYVLVDRGWIAATSRRSDLPQAPAPAAEVTVQGRIDMPPARYLELSKDEGDGPVRQNLDIARIARASALPLLPFIIEQTGDTADGLVREWPAPDFGIERHVGYMVQWYLMAALGLLLWLTLNWRVRP
jgi:cytochrome oxidase assembly protein ShyY1